jgi:RNA polymerase sigma factor (sigma-70 family)
MSDISTKGFTPKNEGIKANTGDNRLKDIPEKYRKDYILVQNILEGNEKSWEEFVTKTQNFLYYTIKKVINKTNLDSSSKRKALEMTEDLFLGFYEHLLKNDKRLLLKYKGKSKLSSYLYVCLSNYVYDFFKSKRWKSYLKEISASEINSRLSDEESEMDISQIVEKFGNTKASFDPEEEMFKKEIRNIIENLVSNLSEYEQLCFNLLFVDGLKPSEVSLILGITSFEVSQIKYRIKEKLKKSGKDKLQEFLGDL